MFRCVLNLKWNGTMWLSFAYVFLLLTASASLVCGQFGGIDSDPGDRGTGGKNSIQGHIYLPSGRPVARHLSVTLTSVTSGTRTILADDNGQFIFRRLSPGTYYITIDAGKEFEPVRETVNVIGNSNPRNVMGQNYMLQIQLRYKATASLKPEVLDVSLVNVPSSAQKLYQKGIAAARSGDARKAVKYLEEAVSAYPQFVLALNELGFQYMRLNELDKAADVLQRAIKIAPSNFSTHLNYGRLLLQQKQFAQAESELRLALKRDETSEQAHFYLARALLEQNNFDEAETELNRTITLSHDGIAEAHRLLGAIYNERGDAKRAIEELEKYLRLAPNVKDAPQVRSIIEQLRKKVATEK